MSELQPVGKTNAERLESLAAVAKKYEELLFAVQRVFPNETRHQTALRYIRIQEAITRARDVDEVVDKVAK